MLDVYAARGRADALRHFGLAKTAGIADVARAGGTWLKELAIGRPGQAFVEGRKTFAPGGMLATDKVWWPSTKGMSMSSKIMPWMQRANTLMAPLHVLNAARQDPNEGTLSNMLGTAGGLVGTAYGWPAMGMLGAPILGRAGKALGHGVAHALGSTPVAQNMEDVP